MDHVGYAINEEEGCTLEAANASLKKAFDLNNFAPFVISLYESMKECIECVDELGDVDGGPGGVIEALLFLEGKEMKVTSVIIHHSPVTSSNAHLLLLKL